jgi:hypothetical protein
VSNWRIKFAYDTPGDPLDGDAIELAGRGIEGEDRQVARHLALAAATDGAFDTVGSYLDHLDRIGQEGRRQVLNEARTELGLQSVEAIDARRLSVERSRALAHLPERDEAGVAWLSCAANGCVASPIEPSTGAARKTNVKRWWCSEHRDQAGPGDLEVWTQRIRLAPGGFGLIFEEDEEVERARQEREEQRTKLEREQRHAERQAGAERLRADEEALAEHYRPKGAGWE